MRLTRRRLAEVDASIRTPSVESGQPFAGRFELMRRLHGGAAQVWQVRDSATGRELALKIVLGGEPEQTALRREFERLRASAGPGVIEAFDFEAAAGYAWYSMELAAGGDLSRLRGQRYEEWIAVLEAAAATLARLHAAGTLHGDLKLSNVLLMAGGARVSEACISDIALGQAGQRGGPADWHGSPYSLSRERRAGCAPTEADDVYAFGVMIYELLSGYPPFYPALPQGTVPPLRPAHPAPAELIQLASACLNEEPMDRPRDMDIIVASLRRVRSEPFVDSPVDQDGVSVMSTNNPSLKPPELSPPTSVPLRSDWRRPATAAHKGSDGSGVRRGITIAAFTVLLAGVAYVTVLLPRMPSKAIAPAAVYKPAGEVGAPAAATDAQAPADAADAEKEKPKPIDLARMAEQKQRAEDKREEIDKRVTALKSRAVDQWGGDDWTTLQQALIDGDAQASKRQFEATLKHYATAELALGRLEEHSGSVLKEQLAAGEHALDEGKSAEALTAFDLALKLDPKNQAAQRGRKRAATLDQVFVLVTQGSQFEQQNEFARAAESYRQALALDPLTVRAKDGLQRTQTHVTNDAFGAAMAKGYAALGRKGYADAREAFNSAGKIRANAPEVAQALKQVEQDERSAAIVKLLERAPGLEAAERWSDALGVYQDALKLDPTVTAAQEGVARAEPRAKLNAELELYLTQPERLFGNAVRAAAKVTLQTASGIQNAGPVLKQQVSKLNEWLARAETPIEISLRSDGITSVTVYRVGELGTFGEKTLTLMPGQYTAVGTRPGYRDVRRQFDVLPGHTNTPVMIACEDKI